MTVTTRARLLELFNQYGSIDGAHHKQWVIDQALRIITKCPERLVENVDEQGRRYTYTVLGESRAYNDFVARYEAGDDGELSYEWDEGRAP